MKPQTVSEIIRILDQQISCEEIQNLLRALQNNVDDSEAAFVFQCMHALSPSILPVECVDCIRDYVLNNISLEEYSALEFIVTQTINTYFKAVCGELVWQNNHDRAIGEAALNAYNTELFSPSYSDEYSFIRIALSICRIYAKVKFPNFDFQGFSKSCFDYVIKNADSGYLILNLLEGIFNCAVDQNQVIATLEQIIDILAQKPDYAKAASFSETLANFYRKAKHKDKIPALRVKIAEFYEKEADTLDSKDSRNVHQILRYIQLAMNAWTKVEDKQASQKRRQLLAKKAKPLKDLRFQSLKSTSSGEYDIAESVNHMRDIIESSSFEQMLVRLVCLHKLKMPDEYIARLRKSGFLFSSIFATNIMDEYGRLNCIVPTLGDASPEDEIAIAEYEAGKEHSLAANAFTTRFLYLARSKHTFTENTLRFLVEDNAFIPGDRKDTFLKGLVAGFNMDLATSMHLLMPQVENAIRCLAEMCGAVVYKTDCNGVEECLSLDSILKLEELQESVEPEVLFNMRVFYTSPYGIGMRDIIGHGLRSDKGLQSAECLAVWWFTLHLVCLFSPELYKRNYEQKQAQTQ